MGSGVGGALSRKETVLARMGFVSRFLLDVQWHQSNCKTGLVECCLT